jgi:hypothetical protein
MDYKEQLPLCSFEIPYFTTGILQGLVRNHQSIESPLQDMVDQNWEMLRPESVNTKKCQMVFAAYVKTFYESD